MRKQRNFDRGSSGGDRKSIRRGRTTEKRQSSEREKPGERKRKPGPGSGRAGRNYSDDREKRGSFRPNKFAGKGVGEEKEEKSFSRGRDRKEGGPYESKTYRGKGVREEKEGSTFRSRREGKERVSNEPGKYKDKRYRDEKKGTSFTRSRDRKERGSFEPKNYKEREHRDDKERKSFPPGRDKKERSSFGEKRYSGKGFRESRGGASFSPSGENKGRFEERDTENKKRWNRKEDHRFYGEKKRRGVPQRESDDGSTRLNKYIANAGICSRREADELIGAGVISVNGEVVTQMGYKVQPGDVVKYNNETLRSERLVYILLNKPKDFITTTDDPEERKTVMSLIEKACRERVYPVGRLDRNTTGVLLFTNDGDLAKRLTHPSFEVQKIYQVELDRALKATDMETISQGIRLEDGLIKPDEIAYVSADKKNIGIELHSGKNRVVRRIFEHMDYVVKKLDRVVFAGLTKKDLPRGRWRFLSEMEVANLKMMTGKPRVNL